MLKSNLRVKLAENGLKISRVYNDTGISRSTLTALVSGDPKGIQFDTINTLCRYLKIEPKDLFIYAPVDLAPTVADLEITLHSFDEQIYNIKGDLYLNFDSATEKITDEFSLHGRIKYNTSSNGLDISAHIEPINNEDTFQSSEIISRLPRE